MGVRFPLPAPMNRSSRQKPLGIWKVVNSKIVYKTPWNEIIEDTCEVHGRKLTYTYMRRIDEGPLIIPEDEDKSLWMVRQYRHPIRKAIWQFPVEGKLKRESWKDAALRGLKEEMGLKANKIYDIGQFYPDPGGLMQKYHIYLAKQLSPVDSIKDHKEVEELEVQKFSKSQIDGMIKTGDICDNWTLTALYLYDRYVRSLRF